MDFSGIKINLQGFDNRSTAYLRAFFKQKCQAQYQLTEQQMLADISITDIDNLKTGDSESNEQFISRYRAAHPKNPLIVLSLHQFQSSDPLVFSLKKPLKTEDFYQLLQQISLVAGKNISPINELREALLKHIQTNIKNNARLETQSSQAGVSLSQQRAENVRLSSFIGRHGDININNPQAVMRVLFDSKNLLLGSIKRGIARAKHNRKIIELTNFGQRFLIDPKTESIFTFVSESVLRPLCLVSSDEVSNIKILKKGRQDLRFDALVNDTSVEVTEWRWEAFLWKISLWTARGKVPSETNLKLPVTLTRWPNFTRLQLIPHALNIAALMSKQPIRLTDLATKLGIEQRYVFSFYSAANMIGIASNSRRQSDNLFIADPLVNTSGDQNLPSKTPKERESIMQKMFQFLLGKSADLDPPKDQKQGVQS